MEEHILTLSNAAQIILAKNDQIVTRSEFINPNPFFNRSPMVSMTAMIHSAIKSRNTSMATNEMVDNSVYLIDNKNLISIGHRRTSAVLSQSPNSNRPITGCE
jgi:hypothetical protein